jgi:hypothetical protein
LRALPPGRLLHVEFLRIFVLSLPCRRTLTVSTVPRVTLRDRLSEHTLDAVEL